MKNIIYHDDHNPIITNIVHIKTDEENWEFPLHKHIDELEISLLIKGTLNVYYGNKFYKMKEKEFIVKSPNIVHLEKGDKVEQICISFKNIHINHLSKNTLQNVYNNPVIQGNSLLVCLFEYLDEHQNIQDDLYQQITQTTLSLILDLIPDNHDNYIHQKNNSIDVTIQNVKEYINQYYGTKISLNSLADQFCLSPSYLSRCFKKFTGFNLNNYLVLIRMGEAQKMLIYNSNLSIKEIALLCGYENIQYFYITFKKHTNLTPLEFRKNYVK